MEKKRPVLSISMLVSDNRRDTIEKCMESLVPLMNAVPSELIIVDTGCTDGSVEIAGRYADKVIEFTWCNDFAAARNAGLRECTGEWFLYLDDDEWFEDVSELIRFLKGKEQKEYDALWYLVRNYEDFEGTSYTDSYVGRMVRLTPETRFCGKIHEYLEPVPKRIKKVTTYVHHYGYLFKSEEDRRKHLERNLTLEEEAVRENPDDIRMCCLLVQEYWATKRYGDAIQLARTTLEVTRYEETNSFVQFLLLVIARIYSGNKEYEAALEEFARLEREHVLLHQSRLALFYERARTYALLQRREDTIRELLRYLEEFSKHPKAGAPEEYPVMDFAQYQSELFFHRAVERAAINMAGGKLYSYADRIFDKADWRKTPKPRELLTVLICCYEDTGNGALFRKQLLAAQREERLAQQVYASLASLYESHPEGRKQLAEDLEPLNLRCGNFAFFHLLYTEERGITSAKDVEEYYTLSDRRYDAEVTTLLLTNREVLSQVLERTPVELYTAAMTELLDGKNPEQLEELQERLGAAEGCYPEEKKGFLRIGLMKIAERRLLLTAEQGGPVRGSLERYVEAAKEYAGLLYRPELLQAGNAELLPASLRFVYEAEQLLASEGDSVAWSEGIKRAARVYPAMLSVVRILAGERRPAESRPAGEASSDNSAQAELLALAEQLKTMVRRLLAEGRTDEAGEILTELAQLLPEDEEVKELLRSCPEMRR